MAFGHEDGFSDDDFDHAFGGEHFLVMEAGEVVAHASVVPRVLRTGGRELATGYVEAVATLPRRQRAGLGTAVMHEAGTFIRDVYELGALGTGVHAFYLRSGWRTWLGPTSVINPSGDREPTPHEDGSVMVHLTPSTAALDLTAPISCDWRPGDVW